MVKKNPDREDSRSHLGERIVLIDPLLAELAIFMNIAFSNLKGYFQMTCFNRNRCN